MSTAAVASPPADTQTWTAEQVCKYLHIAPSTLDLWIKQGRVPEPMPRVGHRRLWDPRVIRSLVTPRGD